MSIIFIIFSYPLPHTLGNFFSLHCKYMRMPESHYYIVPKAFLRGHRHILMVAILHKLDSRPKTR